MCNNINESLAVAGGSCQPSAVANVAWLSWPAYQPLAGCSWPAAAIYSSGWLYAKAAISKQQLAASLFFSWQLMPL